MIFIGFLNIAMSKDVGRDQLIRMLCYAGNIITVFFGILIVVVNKEPQVILGLVLIVLMTITAFMLKK